jgi:ABC-type Mn2+/Zn2+ transport system permease subunit
MKTAAAYFVWLLAMACIGAVALPATAPVDRETQDALNEIDAGSNAPAASRPVAAERGEESGEALRSIELVGLFLPALATAAAVGVSASVVGTFVLLRREGLMALALPQVVAIGAAVGMRLGWPTLPPALVCAGVAAVYFAMSKRWGAGNWILPSFYVAGMSLSFLIIAGSGQHVADLQNVFTGIDVAVSVERARLAVPVLLALAVCAAVLWRRWLLIAQAPTAAEVAGLHPERWDVLFLVLLAVVLLLGTDSLGVVMVLTMLFLPAAAVLPWARRIPAALAGAAVLSLVMLAAGFYLSNRLSWPLSHSVGGVGFAAVAASHVLAQFRR